MIAKSCKYDKLQNAEKIICRFLSDKIFPW